LSRNTVGTGGWKLTGGPGAGSVCRKGASGVVLATVTAESGRGALLEGATAGAEEAQATRRSPAARR